MRKQSRYTIELQEGRKFVVLAYDMSWCWQAYPGAVRITRGDYRKQQRAAMLKASGGFTIDHTAVRAACKLLEVKMPVDIRLNGRVGSLYGYHELRAGRHRIMLKSYCTATEATSTLWHELTHAMQSEHTIRAGKSWDVVSAEQKRYPYSRRPIEVEARDVARRMAPTHPLCH